MEDYKHSHNLMKLGNACNKMLREKFNVILSDDKINILIEEISNEVLTEYGGINLNTNQLNNITLSKIKSLYEKINIQQVPVAPNTPSSQESYTSQSLHTSQSQSSLNNYNTTIDKEKKFSSDILDDDVLSFKLKELEARRQVIPSYSIDTPEPISEEPKNNIIYKANPISITLPSIANTLQYKNFIINSINRDWNKNPYRNFIKFNISIDTNANTFYPQCICFPSFVKNITPYVLMNISDDTRNLFYSFVCKESYKNSKWDTWYPVENVENISLQNKSWSIKFYDFINNELDLGADNIPIIEANIHDGHKFVLKFNLDEISNDNNFKINDILCIRTYSGKLYYKKIIDYIKAATNIITILDDKNELVIDDFINSKILNTNNQFSFIIKYHYDNKT